MASDETFLQEEAKFGVPCGNMKSSILVPNTVELEIALKMEPFDVLRWDVCKRGRGITQPRARYFRELCTRILRTEEGGQIL